MRKHLFAINLTISAVFSLLLFLVAFNTIIAFDGMSGFFMPNIVLFPVLAFIVSSLFALALVFVIVKKHLAAKILNTICASITFVFGFYSFFFGTWELNYMSSRARDFGSLFAYYFPVYVTFNVALLFMGLGHLVFAILLLVLKNKNGETVVVSTKPQVEVKSSTNNVEPKATETKPASTAEVLDRLKELKELFDNEAITEEEYAVLKQKELKKL